MIFNIRYYIITIMIIFISLGIGILIGFNMNGREIFLEQQQELVNNLEYRFNELKFENTNLQNTIEELALKRGVSEQFIGEIYHEIVNDKLVGFNIAIIQTTEHYYYYNIKETLEEAGATVPLHIILSDKIMNIDIQGLNYINNFLGSKLSKEEIFHQINNDIVELLINNIITNLMSFMIDNEFISLLYYHENPEPIGQIVIAGGSFDENIRNSSILEAGLINLLLLNNIRVVGVERLEVLHSSIPLYVKKGISTIDNIDTLFGRISLVFVIKGKEGSFGEKSFAEKLIP